MHITRALGVTLLLLVACAGAPANSGSQEAEKKPIKGGVVEFRLTSYDTLEITGRVMLGATTEPFVVSRKLLEGADISLDKVRPCDKTTRLEYVMADAWIGAGLEDSFTLRPGYWYGVNVHFPLFSEHQTGLGPDCLEANLVVRAHSAQIAATLPIRIERTDKPPASPDGGPPADWKPPASDGGTP